MQLSALYRYPLKSAAAEPLAECSTDVLGLLGDRRWMLVDTAGRFLSQRGQPAMARLKATWRDGGLLLEDEQGERLEVPLPERTTLARVVRIWDSTVDVLDAGQAPADWLSARLGQPCRLVRLPEQRGIPVDPTYARPGESTAFTDGFPFLLIGQASLDDLAERVGRPLAMARFRPNLVVTGSEPYAEDRWLRIRIGDLLFRVVKPCTRCVITTLDPHSGAAAPDREPLATLARYRRVPGGVVFGQNLIAENTGMLRPGMPVEVLEARASADA